MDFVLGGVSEKKKLKRENESRVVTRGLQDK